MKHSAYENSVGDKSELSPEEKRLEEVAVRYLINEGGEDLIKAIKEYKDYLAYRPDTDATDRLRDEPRLLNAIKSVLEKANINLDPLEAGRAEENLLKFIDIIYEKTARNQVGVGDQKTAA